MNNCSSGMNLPSFFHSVISVMNYSFGHSDRSMGSVLILPNITTGVNVVFEDILALTRLRHTFMPSLKISLIHQQLLAKQILNKGGITLRLTSICPKQIYQDTCVIGTHYTKRHKVFGGDFQRYGTF